ncbi:dihydroxyacetone kinase subunit DhaL [Clostridium tepidiprofundi DSM 19306]|uniref:Dihydroxyacetone kinase subunit DhaL n=1 Tax=Clostridium tepidiprofundi DSM 19306 TaxID=1121338 RepID=A0A151B7L0_9CLOT|nr:DAK2 domain-containing protein [Clostridium tepidiprofundi]KYH35905.1 dihydroxyacetone kinase subunit DhaL [Clostridium tepidiprofundi DSM 19306]
MNYLKIDGEHFYNMVVNASNRLEEQKEFVNSLNVFPVPDGDTGTNMSMTFKTAVCEIENINTKSIDEVSKKLARGALMGARGNSGVILSQIFRGISKGMENKKEVNSREFAISLKEGANFAYKAVMRPTEGTILTIIKAAGESAINNPNSDIVKLLEEVCNHCEAVLNKTPDMLPALKKAKVVDAGGMGLLILLKGMLEALQGNVITEIKKDIAKPNISENKQIIQSDIKFGYCTEFFILANNADIESFKKELEQYGDSMVVVAFEDIVKVHIHTNDPGLILSKALKLGELSKIKIDNMREQHRNLLNIEDETKQQEEEVVENVRKKYAFVSVSRGKGLDDIFKDLGVDCVIEGGQTMNPSTQDILKSIEKLNADNIFILPNNKNIIMSASQASELADKNVVVIPSKTIPQGITALTVFDFNSDLDENIKNMNEAIGMVSTGAVTYAVKDTETDGKVIKQGDILGLIEGKIQEIGKDVFNVCSDMIEKMVNEHSELITLYYGEDCKSEDVEKFVKELEEKYSDLDIQYYEGKQPLYYFIVSVE